MTMTFPDFVFVLLLIAVLVSGFVMLRSSNNVHMPMYKRVWHIIIFAILALSFGVSMSFLE